MPGNQVNYRYTELTALGMTVAMKFVLMDWLGMRAFYITGICLFWAGYIAYRYTRYPSILRTWGFTKENFKASLRVLIPFFVLCVAFSLTLGKIRDIRLLNVNTLPVLTLYPVWGMVQQFMLVCILAQNIQGIPFFRQREKWVILLISILFSIVHFPYTVLMIFAFILEIILLTTFFRWHNLWAIGLMHGWTATFVLYFIMDRDLWIELFAWF